jgi:hypothetical protein
MLPPACNTATREIVSVQDTLSNNLSGQSTGDDSRIPQARLLSLTYFPPTRVCDSTILSCLLPHPVSRSQPQPRSLRLSVCLSLIFHLLQQLSLTCLHRHGNFQIFWIKCFEFCFSLIVSRIDDTTVCNQITLKCLNHFHDAKLQI